MFLKPPTSQYEAFVFFLFHTNKTPQRGSPPLPPYRLFITTDESTCLNQTIKSSPHKKRGLDRRIKGQIRPVGPGGHLPDCTALQQPPLSLSLAFPVPGSSSRPASVVGIPQPPPHPFFLNLLGKVTFTHMLVHRKRSLKAREKPKKPHANSRRKSSSLLLRTEICKVRAAVGFKGGTFY